MGEHKIIGLDEEIVAEVKINEVELAFVLYIVVGSQTVVASLFSDLRR